MKIFIQSKSTSKLSVITFLISIFMVLIIGCDMAPPKNSRAAQAIAGKALFNNQCASCHGSAEVAADPAILDTLQLIPPDLKRIMKRRGVTDFPISEIAQIIDGRITVAKHGPREMPVWGQVYEEEGLNETDIKGKKGELIAYLMNIQTTD